MGKKPRPPTVLELAKGILKPDGAADSMRVLMLAHLEAMAVRHFTDVTVQGRAHVLGYFATWCEERALLRPHEVTKSILQRYQRHLFLYRKKSGKPLGISTQHARLMALCTFFRWLSRSDILPTNPAADLELPQLEKRLPRAILAVAEVEKVMAVPDVSDVLGLRDRAILELLYSTGARRAEVANLKTTSIDFGHGTLMIRQGKGRKDRLIPIGERALSWLQRYLDGARLRLSKPPDEGWLFLGKDGYQLSLETLTDIASRAIDAAAIGKRGGCHIFRHTMATLMLEGGADTRYLQAMLGHESLTSTQLYTQVAISKLKEIHSATHPGARLDAPAVPPPELDDDDDDAELLAELDDDE